MVGETPLEWGPLHFCNLIHRPYTRWWQLKYFLCSLRTLGKIPILTSIFQRGWNHQLVYHVYLLGIYSLFKGILGGLKPQTLWQKSRRSERNGHLRNGVFFSGKCPNQRSPQNIQVSDSDTNLPRKKWSCHFWFGRKPFMVLPSRERSHSPPNGKFGKSSTQKWFLMGSLLGG